MTALVGLPARALDLLIVLVEREERGDTGPLLWDLSENQLREARRYAPRLEAYGLATYWTETADSEMRLSSGRTVQYKKNMAHAMPTDLGIAMVRAWRKHNAKTEQTQAAAK